MCATNNIISNVFMPRRNAFGSDCGVYNIMAVNNAAIHIYTVMDFRG